jgi:hypothetical protein
LFRGVHLLWQRLWRLQVRHFPEHAESPHELVSSFAESSV